MDFNNHSRKVNAVLTSASGLVQQALQILGNFAYRTVFLLYFSKEYLGIQGLFFNILQLFSLAELGIGSAILYSMYKPFAEQDTEKIGALVRFYRKVYTMLAVLVLLIGICFYPFIETVVDVSEVPDDVNLTAVYFLFVTQSVISYLFVYKQSVLAADQRNYLVSLFTCILLLSSYAVRTVVLICTKDFELVLLSDILTNLVLNWLFSTWITRKYGSIFQQREDLPREDRQEIYKNTGGLLCHKIGTIVVTSTDNVVLSKFVGLAAVGIYSNYATIVLSITNVAGRMLASLVPTIANYILNKPKEDSYSLFKRMMYLNLWMASFTTVCLFLLLNPFIELWLNETFLLPQAVVAWICMQHYLQTARLTASNYVNSCGLFMRDKIRPLIESVINIAVSVILARKIGIAGVFIGTCVSGLCTYFWREPHLVLKNFFGGGYRDYWLRQIIWGVLTVSMCVAGVKLFELLPGNFPGFLIKVLLAASVPNIVILAVTLPTAECRYFLNAAVCLLRRRKR